jgi:predicted TIM-barrel fold metal-dependent hydrolase
MDGFGPDRCVRGSGFGVRTGRSSAPVCIDCGPLSALVRELVPDRQDRRRILRDTPRRAFGFAG